MRGGYLACPSGWWCPENLFWKLEVHGDLGLNLNRVTVQVVGLVFPLLHRINSGLRNDRFTADGLYRSDAAALANRSQQLYGALYVNPQRRRWIDRRYVLHHQSLILAFRNIQNMQHTLQAIFM